MRIPRSVLVMRIACLVSLAAAGAATAEHIQPARRFCPLAKACKAAAESPLGSVLGIPTSVIGLLGFAGLLFATLIHPKRARKVARPLAGFAAVVGLFLVVYQFVALESPCPLCLVADAGALAAGAAAITWPKWGRKGNPRKVEPRPVRAFWVITGIAVPAILLLWPAPPAPPAWQTIDRPYQDRGGDDSLWPAQVPPAPPPAGTPVPPDPSVPPQPNAQPPPPRAPAERTIQVVEYLNPFCAHCRATYDRLLRVLDDYPRPVRIKRVYVWTTRDVPFWAKGCACAREQGREPAFFDELVQLRGESEAEVRGAAARAHLDVTRWSACILEPDTMNPLLRMKANVDAAGIRLLPTIDVGRRRLNGEQSEAELREALDAAFSE